MVEARIKYKKDHILLTEIISAMPKRVESTLALHRNKILGTLPKSRDDLDPVCLLSKHEGGETILVLDSNKDLPTNWKQIDLRKEFGCSSQDDPGVATADDDDATSDAGTSDAGTSDAATSDAATDDGGTSDGVSDDAVTNGDAATDKDLGLENTDKEDDEYQEVTLNSTVNLETVGKPPRVLVFTNLTLLGLLAVCKYGSVDGTFKSMSKQWKQLFVFMVDYKGAFLPVAFGWLPDKRPVSYHVFLLLLLIKFKAESDGIGKIYCRTALKLKKVKLDFETAIHRAFEVLFQLSGCFFHFSQACWRRVQKGGLVIAYMQDRQFRGFVRSVVALAFLPLNQLEAAVDDLRAVEFDEDSAFHENTTKFKEAFLNYLESTWLYGNFPPKLWNMWKKKANLTNNNNEGYNSRINKLIAVIHPNPWILMSKLVKELIRAETEAIWIQVCLGCCRDGWSLWWL